MFGLVDYLVWLDKERLNSFIFRQSHDHWFKYYRIDNYSIKTYWTDSFRELNTFLNVNNSKAIIFL